MYGRMTHSAGLIFLGLVMERWCGWSRRIHCQSVALKAKQVYVAALEQSRVRGTVGRMASDAALGLDGGMFPGEWTSFVGVAVKADHILGSGGAQLVRHETAVLVVAVAAGNEPFIHPMMERLGEIRLDFKMAGVAERRLRRLQQLPVHFGRVYRVAVHAPNVVFQVLRPQEVAVLFAKFVAGEAALGRLFPRKSREPDDLRRIG